MSIWLSQPQSALTGDTRSMSPHLNYALHKLRLIHESCSLYHGKTDLYSFSFIMLMAFNRVMALEWLNSFSLLPEKTNWNHNHGASFWLFVFSVGFALWYYFTAQQKVSQPLLQWIMHASLAEIFNRFLIARDNKPPSVMGFVSPNWFIGHLSKRGVLPFLLQRYTARRRRSCQEGVADRLISLSVQIHK